MKMKRVEEGDTQSVWIFNIYNTWIIHADLHPETQTRFISKLNTDGITNIYMLLKSSLNMFN